MYFGATWTFHSVTAEWIKKVAVDFDFGFDLCELNFAAYGCAIENGGIEFEIEFALEGK